MIKVLSQKEAVRSALTQVLTEAGIVVGEGSNFKEVMTKEYRAQVNQILFQGFRAGTIALKGEKTDQELKDYVSGLQSNWLNKDKAINGGVVHMAMNPGSRTGSADSQIKALRSLLKISTDSVDKVELQGYIDARLREINVAKPTKARVVKIDFDALPAELQAKYK